jgi:hypothetical protein
MCEPERKRGALPHIKRQSRLGMNHFFGEDQYYLSKRMGVVALLPIPPLTIL